MDATAIKEIERLANEAAKNRDLDTDSNTILVDGKVIPLEQYDDGRFRFRGRFATNSIRDFAEYVKENHRPDHSQGFVDTNKLSATVFLNIGNLESPGHCDWTASIVPKETAAYAALRKIDGKPLSQRDATDWLEDWHPFLKANYGADTKPLTAAIAALRDIKVSTKGEQVSVEGDTNRKRSAMEEVEASSAGGIPSSITMNVEPYEELRIRDFTLRISVITGGPAPQILFRLAQKEAIEEDIAQEFKKVLRQMIGDTPKFTAGTFQP